MNNYNHNYELAANPNTPKEVLTELSKDNRYPIRRCVARNPNLPIEALLGLSEDKDDYVRDNAEKSAIDIISNKNTSIEIIITLSKTSNFIGQLAKECRMRRLGLLI